MKRLIVMRHAKAAHRPGLADAERPLTGRGRKDAAAAGAWLASRGLTPDLVLCSPSLRTRQTWECLAPALASVPATGVWYEPRLYQADEEDMLDVVAGTPAEVPEVLVIGHNPAAEQVASSLTGRPALELPTSAIAVIGLGGWARLAAAAGTAEAFWSPGSAARA